MSPGGVVPAIVRQALPNARFLCEAEEGPAVTCHVAGEMRMKVVRILPGDGVRIERSPLDPSKGRIVGKAGRQDQ